MRRVYLKIATQSLVIAASISAALKPLWFDPTLKILKSDMMARRYADSILLALYVVFLVLIYKFFAGLLLAVFNNVLVFRQMLDKDFDVEGAWVERVYINGELEVVGRSEITFGDGELKLESHAYWPQTAADGVIRLTRVAQVTSVDEMCSVKDLAMQYVFQDKYRETPQNNKTGLTKLNFIREQHPGFWRKLLWRRGRLTEYSGSFDSFERNIDGTIIGTRLGRDAAKKSRDEPGRLEILAHDVRQQLSLGKKLRTTPPGE
jgi:hypothetical protein